MEHIELHPLCTLFPRLNGAEFATLRDDIRVNGLRQPIVLHEGMILDGGNRYRACVDAGVKPTFTKFGGGNLVDFVLSANLHRRHMSAGQQAAIVASATDWGKANAHGGNRKKDQAELGPLETVAQRAAVSGANEKTQRKADRLVRESPVLAKEVTQGKKSLYQAVKDSKPSKILPRQQSKAKPAKAEPLDVARDHAKKQNKAIKDLRAEIAARDQRIEALTAELRESRENASELAESLEACVKSGEGQNEAAKEIKRLLGVVRVVEATRDQYMTKCSELVKSIKSLERKVEKCEAKK